jgi:hypothetical protein
VSGTVDHGDHRTRFQCLTGTVTLTQSPGVGATHGSVATFGFHFPIRQVLGPNNRGIPLSQAGGMQARVCGRPVPDGDGGLVLEVSSVEPLLQ